jgi:ubiquinone/menaquinone biosynthesis C-methylase UbiE
MAETMAAGSELDVSFIEASAENIPLDDNSVDTVLVTYSLCTIPAAVTALAEMHRVLRPEGQLIFCEHGHAPDENVQRWQRRLNPVWKRFGGGCNLNRHIPDLLRQGGFKIQMLESDYIPGWKPASFNYWGTAIHQ